MILFLDEKTVTVFELRLMYICSAGLKGRGRIPHGMFIYNFLYSLELDEEPRGPLALFVLEIFLQACNCIGAAHPGSLLYLHIHLFVYLFIATNDCTKSKQFPYSAQ